jgi:hypothetical protein
LKRPPTLVVASNRAREIVPGDETGLAAITPNPADTSRTTPITDAGEAESRAAVPRSPATALAPPRTVAVANSSSPENSNATRRRRCIEQTIRAASQGDNRSDE